jgi:hypothetical protein
MNKSFLTSEAVPVERHGSLGLFVIVPGWGVAPEMQLDLQEEPLRG